MALQALVLEAFFNWISARPIEPLAPAMGIENISVSQVSVINKGLSGQMASPTSEGETTFLI